ncbi:MAG: hypothetical protein JWO07_727 [Candidatus Saccharibacteria bacterium]|nr:hypothetical protein [Candidatus Saccharibacteria bacterium]
MPRRNKQVKHTPFIGQSNDDNKVRYASQNAAERAAEIRMLQVMGLELAVYQGLDGGWYLTSVKSSTK